MKQFLYQLEKLKENIEDKIESRENTYEDRTEKWQESEKGEMFQYRIDQMSTVLENLDETIESVNAYLVE